MIKNPHGGTLCADRFAVCHYIKLTARGDFAEERVVRSKTLAQKMKMLAGCVILHTTQLPMKSALCFSLSFSRSLFLSY